MFLIYAIDDKVITPNEFLEYYSISNLKLNSLCLYHNKMNQSKCKLANLDYSDHKRNILIDYLLLLLINIFKILFLDLNQKRLKSFFEKVDTSRNTLLFSTFIFYFNI